MPVSYFSNFPLKSYSLNTAQAAGEYEWVTDIFRRAAPVTGLLKNRELFYTYEVIDGDTPEILADVYYGSPRYFWVVTLLNNILDPILDWPMKYANLIAYINNKYGSLAIALATTHHYTMTIAKVDSLGHSSSETSIIDATKYAALSSVVPVVTTFASGVTVTTTTTRAIVDAQTYEIELNDAKRKIQLLKPSYVPQVVAELETLISAP